jgi:uncharacterized protein (DUF697 family)
MPRLIMREWTEQETRSIVALCLMAALSDGSKGEEERAQVREVAASLGGEALSLTDLYRDVLLKRLEVEQAAAVLSTPELRRLAYEMAVAVCDADGVATGEERSFLGRLARALDLAEAEAEAVVVAADAVAAVAVVPPAPVAAVPAVAASPGAKEADPELERSVLRYAIVAGALELLPQSLASLAILPLQVKMVYRIGRHFGYTLDSGHIKEFVAAIGVGMTGQMVDGMARKLIGKLAKGMAGGLVGGVARSATSAGVSFATTWALGQVARQYYASNRRLDMASLRGLFTSLRSDGQRLAERHGEEIRQQAGSLDLAQVMRGNFSGAGIA